MALTDKQLSALQAACARLIADGDPRMNGPRGEQYPGDPREIRMAWARAHLGRASLTSFSFITESEAGYLLDIANGRTTRLDRKIQQSFNDAGIEHPAEWLERVETKKSLDTVYTKTGWKLHGKQPYEMNRVEKIALVNLLVTRGRTPQKRKSYFEEPRVEFLAGGRGVYTHPPRPGPRIGGEQAAAWGM